MSLPNPAPEIDTAPPPPKAAVSMGGLVMSGSASISSVSGMEGSQFEDPDEPKRKKYANKILLA